MTRKKHTISIVVPVYNEFDNIAQFHQKLLSVMSRCKDNYEIIYVDDHSTDGTHEWLQSISLEPTVRVIRKIGVKGKAFSLIQGFQNATGDILAMIDGDLQYPPEKLPELIQELSKADIVVANRKAYKDGWLRKLLSSGFRTLFGGALFGLKTDIQSGMKVFTREVYETVKSTPVSPWTFDLEFLYRAHQAGFVIKNVPITFSPRMHGESKVHVLRQSYEIGTNALYIKMKRTFYVPILPEGATMRGAGIGHKKKKYITHTTLPASMSAIKTFSFFQKSFFLLTPFILLYLFFAFPLTTARIVVAVLSVFYFIDAIFNIFVVLRSMQTDYELHTGDDELASLDESKLPTYSILCPLYKEAHVVPQFLEGIAKIDWPKEKLDVMFLLESDDEETIQAFSEMTLPYYARTVIVPHSQPKTKPKACNYGLSFAKGEYLVIYDAEDVPDPLQLKKAYICFKKAPSNVKCLQAKLSYYNSRQNLLTRFFTAEYALWFDLTLPGLQSLNSALPLGGTSNHFETAILNKLNGWDPFNVTEDADLGVRLFQKGYRTAIFDSTTYEEATSVSKNWIRQRSRWIKGYMQTYLVHMRNVIPFIKSNGLWHNAIFQMTVGGKILFALLNPFMWIITILYVADYSTFGPILQEIYQPPFAYLAVFSMVFGNFLFLYAYMIAVAKRKQWDMTKYVLLIPVYWVMMSVAASMALYQLLFKPHYWEKTVHGFHLLKKPVVAKQPLPLPRPVVQPAIQPAYAGIHVKKIKHPFIKAYLHATKFGTKAFIWRWLPLFAILNVDLVLARYFLTYEDIHVYLFVSLFGKAFFLLSQLAANILATYVSRNKLTKAYLYRAVFFTFLLNWIGFVTFGLEGAYSIPAIFGNKLLSIIPYMSYYLFGLLCLGIAYRLTTFNFYKRNYTFTMVSLAAILLEGPLVYFHHATIKDIVLSFAYIGSLDLIVILMVELRAELKQTLNNNISSFISIFEKSTFAPEVSESNLRILVFNWRDTKHIYSGGAEVYVHELAKRWVANGNVVTLFCGNDKQQKRYERIDGVEIYRSGGTYTVYLFAFMYYFMKFRGKYDVIIDCENGIPFFTPLYAKEQVILLIHHVHQEIFRNFLSFPLNIFAEKLEGKLMPHVYRNKDVVTVSASSQRDIEKLGITMKENIQIIPNGVNSQLFVDYPKTDYPSFVYLGRLKEYKNIDVAIKAFAKVVRIKKDAKFSIVGSGESAYALKKLVSQLGIEKAVTFYGKVNEEEKAELLSRSWAAIQPSQMEGWGLTVIEANAAGTPVIASQVKGLQDSVINNMTGILVPAGSVSRFAKAMMRIADDDALRMKFSEEAKIWAKTFDWNKSSELFYNLIGRNFGQRTFNPSYPEIVFSPTEKN